MDDRSRELAARFELPMLAFALLVIPTIAIEQSDVGEPWDTIAVVLNWTIWLAFLAEMVTMLAVVPTEDDGCTSTRWKSPSSS